MKNIVFSLAGIFLFNYTFCQTKITDKSVTGGSAMAHSSAALEVESNAKGMLLSRVALTSTTDVTTIASPANSLVIYNTTTAGTQPDNVTPGYYYWNAATNRWIKLSDYNDIDLRMVGARNHVTKDAGTNGLGMSAGTTAAANIFIGFANGYRNTSGIYNVTMGDGSMLSNTTGNQNTVVGALAFTASATGSNNTIFGNQAGRNGNPLNNNVLIGFRTAQSGAGNGNVVIGSDAGQVMTGNTNTLLGSNSAIMLNAGSSNVMIGSSAGNLLTNGSFNVLIGNSVQTAASTTGDNQLNIGNWIYGDNGKIGIGTKTPNSYLQVNGSVSAGIRSLSNSNTVQIYDFTIIATGATAKVFTLPSPGSSTGRMLYFRDNSDIGGSTTVSGHINGNATASMLVGSGNQSTMQLQCDGSTWWILLNN